MNYLLLGINGEVGKAIIKDIYNGEDEFILTYNSKKPNIRKKNIFLYKLNFEKLQKNIQKIKEIIKKHKKIDTIINNVGDASPYKDILKIKYTDFDQSMKINFYSPLFIILENIKNNLNKKSKLNVINVSSNTIKFYGSQKNVPYLISKSALEVALLNLSKSFTKRNIKINIIRPGLINTNMSTKLKNYTKKNFLKRKKLVPLGKLGDPEDISNMISFLVSEKSKFVFGEIFTVSGGE